MDKITYKTNSERIRFCQSKGIDVSQHCCLDMAWFISDPVEWESQGPNPVIFWIGSWNEYLIHMSRKGNSATPFIFVRGAQQSCLNRSVNYGLKLYPT